MFEQAFKNIDDVLRKEAGCTTELDYTEKTETWFFSVVDIIQVLTQQPDYQTARKYWNKLKERLSKEGQSIGDKLSPTEIARC